MRITSPPERSLEGPP